MITRTILERHYDPLPLSQPSSQLACSPNRALDFPGCERSVPTLLSTGQPFLPAQRWPRGAGGYLRLYVQIRKSMPASYTDSAFRTDCGWIFAQHFCNRLGPAYLQLKNVLDETNPTHAEVLNDIKRRFREETFTRDSIQHVIHTHPELVCYVS
jgi:hypothetical protein